LFVIDPEFAFVGPFGFDIGAVIANLVNNYIHHYVVTEDVGFKIYLLEAIHEVLELFHYKFLDLWRREKNSALVRDGFLDKESMDEYKQKFMKNILRDSIGFAGAKIARRVYGVAGVEEIRGIEDKEDRKKAEDMALKIARKFVMNYESIESPSEVIGMIQSES